MRQVCDLDRSLLVAYCAEWSLYRRASEPSRRSLTIHRGTGARAPSPYFTIANRALAIVARLASELGLRPSSRTRLGATMPPDDRDAFAEFDQPLPRPTTTN
jgi:P27 family predicted phage terminase small subunit